MLFEKNIRVPERKYNLVTRSFFRLVHRTGILYCNIWLPIFNFVSLCLFHPLAALGLLFEML